MSHELTTRKNGFVEMGFVEGTARWHGLGNPLREGASIEEWTQASGMDWQVKRSRVRYGEGASQRIMDENHVLFRSDTKAPLGIVSESYKVVHPGEVLEFFRDLVSENGYQLTTAGTLFGGKRFWALAKITEACVTASADRVGGFLLLSSSCDGSMKTEARETTVCVVCNNTLRMAKAEKGLQAVQIGHRSQFDADAMKRRLGISREKFAEFIDAAQTLSRIRVSQAAAQSFVQGLLKIDPKEDKRAHYGEAKILELFGHTAKGGSLEGRKGTAWGLVNAVTEFVDHHARAHNPENRLVSAWWGAGDDLKSEAFRKAFALV